MPFTYEELRSTCMPRLVIFRCGSFVSSKSSERSKNRVLFRDLGRTMMWLLWQPGHFFGRWADDATNWKWLLFQILHCDSKKRNEPTRTIRKRATNLLEPEAYEHCAMKRCRTSHKTMGPDHPKRCSHLSLSLSLSRERE